MKGLIDPKFKVNSGKYIAQCILVTLSMFLILRLLDTGENAAIIGALGATAFIAFTMRSTTTLNLFSGSAADTVMISRRKMIGVSSLK